MQTISASDPAAAAALRDCLGAGGLAAYPTDTLYGLGVDAQSDVALRRLIDAKGRGGPFSIMVGNVKRLAEILLVPPASVGNIRLMLPGPYAFIAPPHQPDLWPKLLTGGRANLGVRVPGHAFLAALYSGWDKPVVTTSANRTGRPALQDPAEIARQFGNRLDLIIDGGILPASRGSTLIDVSQQEWQVLRQGDGPFPV